jgi:hypothetical protein
VGRFTVSDSINSYWQMPFRKRAKITMENLDDHDMTLLYQVNCTLTEVPTDAAYFHAQFRRVNKLTAKNVYTILDGVRGRGQYVGTCMAWQANSPGWWGEGEIKFFFDVLDFTAGTSPIRSVSRRTSR